MLAMRCTLCSRDPPHLPPHLQVRVLFPADAARQPEVLPTKEALRWCPPLASFLEPVRCHLRWIGLGLMPACVERADPLEKGVRLGEH